MSSSYKVQLPNNQTNSVNPIPKKKQINKNYSTTNHSPKSSPQKGSPNKQSGGIPKKTFKLKLNVSEYSKLYKNYILKQYPTVQTMIKKIVQMEFCKEFYLKYPLDGLLKGICKKLLINVYELIVFGYFLSQVEWKLDAYIYQTLADLFPNVIHVNEPTDIDRLKEISIFLYFSCYSIKQLLTQDMTIYRQQMCKMLPQFESIQNSWASSQQTVGQILNLRVLNKFFEEASHIKTLVDYNTCVDKVLQISPCYDITKNGPKQHMPSCSNGSMMHGGNRQILNFGFMNEYNAHSLNHNDDDEGIQLQAHQGLGEALEMAGMMNNRSNVQNSIYYDEEKQAHHSGFIGVRSGQLKEQQKDQDDDGFDADDFKFDGEI